MRVAAVAHREDGKDGHRVGGGDERAEREAGEHAHRVADAELATGIDDPADHEGRRESTDEGEEHGGPQVLYEGDDLHVEAGIEDDRWEQPRHEELEVELFVGGDGVVAGSDGKVRHEEAEHDAHARLGQPRDVHRLDNEPTDDCKEARHGHTVIRYARHEVRGVRGEECAARDGGASAL